MGGVACSPEGINLATLESWMDAQAIAVIQVRGGMGLSADTSNANFFLVNRFVRITNGSHEVHPSQLGKLKAAEYTGC